MEAKVTMADIGKALGVSTVTVSRALAGKDGVGEAMRESILQKAAELGYQSKLSQPVQPGGETVGILISVRFIGWGHSFYWDMYERVLELLSEHDRFGILEPVKLADESAGNLPRLVRANRVQALLLIGQFEPAYQQALCTTGLPMVQLDAYFAGTVLDTVISDNYYGMYAMTDHLLQRGHRRIGYVGSVGTTSSITDRYFGYCRALREWGIPLREDWVLPDRKEGEKVLISLPEEMPTAFVCSSDWVASRLIERLRESGLRVPEDVSIVGFDGFSMVPISPALTTYAVDMARMARAALELLQERIAHPDRRPELRIIPGYLREGDSVKTI